MAPWAIGGVLLLSLALYLPPYKNAFVGDDYLHLSYISNFLQEPWEVWRVFHPTWTTWYYRPLQNIWFLLNRLLFGLTPFPYYYLQGLWHALTVCSVYALARRLRVRRAGALLATALFAVNAQHHDVVAWASSMAIIMAALLSLLATAAYVAYLQPEKRRSPAKPSLLVVAILLTVLAMFSHEEGLLLPPLLLVMRLSLYRRRPLRRSEAAAGSFLLFLMLVLGAVHFLRPNNTISLQGQAPLAMLAYLHPSAVANYLVSVAGRWLFLNKTVTGLWLLESVRQLAVVELLLATGLLALMAVWYLRGGRAVKLGLAWAALHLAFLYAAVWKQRPELFAGRHLYSSWAALSLAVGALAGGYLTVHLRGRAEGSRLRLALAALAAILALNCLLIGTSQRAWQERTTEVAGVARQMKQLLPQAPAQAQMFAHRFVLQPGFVAAAAAVWYEQPQISGGSLSRLKAQGAATANTYLWDFEDGRLYNAMPAFQDHARTIPLWQPSAAAIVGTADAPSTAGRYTLDSTVGPPNARRLGMVVEPPHAGWISLAYRHEVPAGGVFMVDVWGEAGTAARLRVEDGSDQMETVATLLITESQAGRWQTLVAPLTAYEGQHVTMHLDVQHAPQNDVFLTVPRFAVSD